MTTDTTSNGVDWPPEFQQQALQEGWDVWDCWGSASGPFQVQKLEEPGLIPELGYDEPKFDDDTDAWVYVRTKAAEGSELHQRALLFIEHNNSLEYARIMLWPEEVATDAGVVDGCETFDPTEYPTVFGRGRCDGCGLGLTEHTTHDEEACVRAEAERTGTPLSHYGR